MKSLLLLSIVTGILAASCASHIADPSIFEIQPKLKLDFDGTKGPGAAAVVEFKF